MQVNWKPSQPNERYPRAALSPRAGRIARGFIVGCSSYGLWLVVVGELVNDCDDAAGVVLRITLRDQAGNVLNSQSQTSMRL
jgi:hypothetical protein